MPSVARWLLYVWRHSGSVADLVPFAACQRGERGERVEAVAGVGSRATQGPHHGLLLLRGGVCLGLFIETEALGGWEGWQE
jgi:hypothetical protein